MTASLNEVWVTGLGVLSAAGEGSDRLLEALSENRFCATPERSPLPVPSVGRYTPELFEDPGFPDDRKCHLGLAAAEQAWLSAGQPDVSPERLSVFLGTGLSSITPGELAEDLYPHLKNGSFDRKEMAADLSPERSSPRRHIPQRLTMEISRRINAKGPVGTSFSACSAAAQAIAEGMRTLRRDQADIALVGGQDSMDHPMGLLSFLVLGALSSDRCRPFDVNRNGFMLGEGAGYLILERESHARARGARPLARLLGAGTSIDAWNATAPHPEGKGAEVAMRRALRDARLNSDAVDHINAHGTGTPLGDRAESLAIGRVFGTDVPVCSTKGAFGHAIAAAGALEAVVAVLCLQNKIMPGTVGLEEPDKSLPAFLNHHPVEKNLNVVLSNSFGFGGQNCSLIFAKV